MHSSGLLLALAASPTTAQIVAPQASPIQVSNGPAPAPIEPVAEQASAHSSAPKETAPDAGHGEEKQAVAAHGDGHHVAAHGHDSAAAAEHGGEHLHHATAAADLHHAPVKAHGQGHHDAHAPHTAKGHHGNGGHGNAGHGNAGHGNAGHGNGGHDTDAAGGKSVAVGLIATALALPIMLSFILGGGVRADLTWKLLDTFVSIFMAICWFSAFSHVVKLVGAGTPGAQLALGAAQFALLYALAIGSAYFMAVRRRRQLRLPSARSSDGDSLGSPRDELESGALNNAKHGDKHAAHSAHDVRLAALAACAAHYVAFAGVHAGGRMQNRAYESLDGDKGDLFDDVGSKSVGTLSVWLFSAVFLCIMALGSWVARAVRDWGTDGVATRREKSKLEHAVEEVEIDVGALLTSFLVTQAVRTTIMGAYPQLHLLFAQTEVGVAARAHAWDSLSGGHRVRHTFEHRMWILAYALLCTFLAGFALPRLGYFITHTAGDGWGPKAAQFTRLTIVMCASWGFLLYGEWAFLEGRTGDQLFNYLVFAMGCSAVALLVIQLFSHFLEYKNRRAVTQARQEWAEELREAALRATVGLSLCSAFAWEHVYNLALEIFAHHYQVGLGGLIPKLGVAILLPSVILPVYVQHIKPYVPHDSWET